MNIKQTIITATVALTMVAMIAPMTAGATTVSDLQAQIQALMAQLNTLQGSSTTTTTTGSTPAACVGVTFTRNLRVGMTGQDVKCFQVLLNTHGFVLAVSGAGSPGMETMYFGPRTLAAVQKWQVAQGWAPANQVGPLSRAMFNSWLAGTTSTTTTTTTTTGYPAGCVSNTGYSTTTGQSCASGVTVVPTGAGLSVSLASDNPMSTTIVGGSSPQALAPLAKFVFANGDNAPITITNFSLQRIGLSADADLANVYLFNGANRLTDAASVSSGEINFNAPNGLFTVPAGSSLELTVYTDLSTTSTAGETMGVSIPSMSSVVSNASSVHGNFPLSGNLMSVATASLGTFAFTVAATPSGTPTIQPAPNTVMFDTTVQVGTRALNLQWMRFRDIGSASYSAFANFRLYVAGVQVGNAVPSLDSNGYVTFDLTGSPLLLQTGSPEIKVLADIVGGSYRTFSFSIYNTADIRVVDTQYGANVLPTGVATYAATGTITLAQGQVTVQAKNTSPSGNVVVNASNVDLADFTLTASGEPVKITSLQAGVVCSASKAGNAGYRNGALYANGVQVGSTATLNCITSTSDGTGYQTYQLGSSLIVNPGSPETLSIHADVYATGGTALVANTDTLVAALVAPSVANGQGQGSLQTTFIPAQSTIVTGSQLSVVSGGTLTLSKYTAYTNQTVVAPQTRLAVAQFTLSGNTNEGVNISTMNVQLNGALSTSATNVYVVYGTNTTQIVATPTASAGNNVYSISYLLPAGQTIPVTVYADISSSATGTGSVTMQITGTTASSGVSATTGGTVNSTIAGQNITFSTGTLAVAYANVPSNNQVLVGGQQILAGKYKFTAANDSYSITELKVRVPNNTTANSSAIQNAILQDDSTNAVLSTQPFNTLGSVANDTVYFTGLNIPVAANSVKYVDVYYLLATPNATFSTDQLDVQPTVTYVKSLNSAGTVETSSNGGVTGTNAAGKSAYVFKSVPTFTSQTVNSNYAASGTNPELYKFTVAADPKGSVSIQQLKFSVAITHGGATSAPTISHFTLSRDGTDITGVVSIRNSSGTSLTGANSLAAGSNQVLVVRFNNEEVIAAGSSHVYSLRGTVASFLPSTSGNDSVSVALSASNDSAANVLTKKYEELSSSNIEQLVTSAGASAADEDIIWSDMSANSHTDDNANTVVGTNPPTSTGDWANGYLLPGLPLYASSVSAQ